MIMFFVAPKGYDNSCFYIKKHKKIPSFFKLTITHKFGDMYAFRGRFKAKSPFLG
jgi:hypothetical protein